MSDAYEIVFSFDTTGSMYSCLEEVRKRLQEIVLELKRKIPRIRIAIFAHGDYCDAQSTYVTKYLNFTDDLTTLTNFVGTVARTGGGDTPECYELVMREVQEKLSWSVGTQKSLVMIGDAPPHEKSESQNYRQLDWKEEAKRLRDMDIKIYAVQCLNCMYEFYPYIASRTFGDCFPLVNFNEVKAVLLKICFREAGLDESTSGYGLYSKLAYTSPVSVVTTKEEPFEPLSIIHGDTDSDFESDDDDDLGMRCCLCSMSKPPNEFPQEPLTALCKHYYGACLRCVIAYVKDFQKCPEESCGVYVDPHGQQVRLFEAILDNLFLDYEKVLENRKKCIREKLGNVITVSAMNGDSVVIPYKPDFTINDVKCSVEKELGIKVSQQKILFRERGLKSRNTLGQLFTLQDYGIASNENLSLIVPLYCIPESLDHVVFDLSWGFPADGPDFLDASCMAFEGKEFIQVIDWNHSTNDYYLKGAIVHSAKNETKAGGRIGHQTIHLYLKRLPNNINHLYFTLSSWRSPNLAAFSRPTLQFYEASTADVNLCSTTFSHALHSQAVVMCSVVRHGTQWQIFECGADGCVDGNSKRYNPIRQRIVELIDIDVNE